MQSEASGAGIGSVRFIAQNCFARTRHKMPARRPLIGVVLDR
jgi:hypothetical protein